MLHSPLWLRPVQSSGPECCDHTHSVTALPTQVTVRDPPANVSISHDDPWRGSPPHLRTKQGQISQPSTSWPPTCHQATRHSDSGLADGHSLHVDAFFSIQTGLADDQAGRHCPSHNMICSNRHQSQTVVLPCQKQPWATANWLLAAHLEHGAILLRALPPELVGAVLDEVGQVAHQRPKGRPGDVAVAPAGGQRQRIPHSLQGGSG